MKSLDDILIDYKAREGAQSALTSRQLELRDAYNSDVVLPAPEGITGADKPAVANLIQQGLDQISMRVASVMPQLFFPPLKPEQKSSREKAAARRNAILGWWEDQRMRLKMRRRARYLIGYACSPVVVRPDWNTMGPLWELRDPLKTYPAPALDPDEICPVDCIFAFTRGRAWLARCYPEEFARLNKAEGTETFKLLEYLDAEERVLMVVGDEPSDYQRHPGGSPFEQLLRIPNRTELCPAVVPKRINLDRPQSQFDGILGMYVAQAALQALNLLAIQRGVLPETWFVYPEGRRGDIITLADANEGVIGEVQGATIQTLQPQPGVFTNPALDRLEYAERQTAGIPAEFGGMSGSNIRTGRRGDAVMSATVDFHVQEAQEIFEHSLREENRRAIAIAKSYFGSQAKSFYLSTKQMTGKVDYVPNKDFETDQHSVSYAYAGADENALNVAGGQLVGLRSLSRRSFMEIHPLVKDPELEHDRIIADAIEEAGMASVLQLASQPGGPYQPKDLARLAELVISNRVEWFDAIQTVDREIQERQAEQAGGAPQEQPGLGVPGEPGVPQAPQGPSLEDMRNRLATLRLIQMAGNAEQRGVRPGAAGGGGTA